MDPKKDVLQGHITLLCKRNFGEMPEHYLGFLITDTSRYKEPNCSKITWRRIWYIAH